MDTIHKIFAEIATLENERDELKEEIHKLQSDGSRYYISSICPKCHPEPGRLFIQIAESTCDYQCNRCYTEFNVYIKDEKSGKLYIK